MPNAERIRSRVRGEVASFKKPETVGAVLGAAATIVFTRGQALGVELSAATGGGFVGAYVTTVGRRLIRRHHAKRTT